MPLLTCPDCGGPVSDRAAACPRCGRPSEPAAAPAPAPAPAWPPPPPDARPATARPGMLPEWAKPEHTFAGKAYIVLSYLSAGVLFLVGLLLIAAPGMFGTAIEPEAAAAGGVFCVVFAALFAAVTRGVSRFATWAWWVTMVLLVLSTFGSLVSVFDPAETPVSRAISVLTLLLNGIWLHYFWTRREDF